MILSFFHRRIFFSPSVAVFPSTQNQHLQIPIRSGMVDEHALFRCAISKSLSIYLTIYLYLEEVFQAVDMLLTYT